MILKDFVLNNVDPDDMTLYEQSNLDLHCLQRYLFWFDGLKVLNQRRKKCICKKGA